MVCPITSNLKGYPFESVIPKGLVIQGVVLSDQVRSLDWRQRRAKFIGRVPDVLLQDVMAKIAALLGLDDVW